jgi:predicted transglutaminase-like cysteine proteinase
MLVAAAIATPAAARTRTPAFLGLGPVAAAPVGFEEMCRRDQVLCNLGMAPERLIAGPERPRFFNIGFDASCTSSAQIFRASLTPVSFTVPGCPASLTAAAMPSVTQGSAPALPEAELAKLLKRVNSAVNKLAWQVDDRQSYGVEDRWTRLSTKLNVGDCEDLAIEKRVRLEQAGFPAERMFLALAYKSGFGLHTVLIARLETGDVVLDSLEARVRPWGKVRYSWLRAQAPGNPAVWHRVGKGTAAPVSYVQGAAPTPAVTSGV